MADQLPAIDNSAQRLFGETLEHIKKITAEFATDVEFAHFIHLCKVYGLDPLAKEIYFIKYNAGAKPQIMTSRDGYLKIANNDPAFNGMESEVVYEGDVLVRRDNGSIHITYGPSHLAFDKSKIKGAYCSVFRNDRDVAFTSFVSIKEYGKTSNKIWEQYTNAMILKVAESTALKKAFAISGMVTKEEVATEGLE